jgi:nucleoside phosphorylase
MPERSKPTQSSLVLKPGVVRPRVFFLHFFDIHFLEEKGLYAKSDRAISEMALAVRFAVILGSRILIPAASFYESPIAAAVLKPFLDADVGNLFRLVGSGSSLEEFRYEKIDQYRRSSTQKLLYSTGLEQPTGWERRRRSATTDIGISWMADAEGDATLEDFHPHRIGQISDHDFQNAWLQVPERLGREAFIVPHVLGLLPLNSQNLVVENSLHRIVNHHYFQSYAKDFGAAIFQKMNSFGGDLVPSGNPGDDIDFSSLLKMCRANGFLTRINNSQINELDTLCFDPKFQEAFSMSQIDGTVQSASPAHHLIEVDLAILTALPKEREAVEEVFGKGELKTIDGDPNIYRVIRIDVDGSTKTVVLGVLSGMGNTRSGSSSADFLRSFNARHTLLLGIAGGCPNPSNFESHVRLGDVVIGQSILEHDLVKRLVGGKIEVRDTAQRLSYSITQIVRHMQSDKSGFDVGWLDIRDKALEKYGISPQHLPDDVLHDKDGQSIDHPEDKRRNISPAIVHFGKIGAGDTLLKDPVDRDRLRDEHGIVAVEMEGAGFREAGWSRSREIGIIRGIVDYCDGHKSDDWHTIAAVSAASVARFIFEALVRAGK